MNERPVIRIHGARENNLRDLDLEIPRYALTVISGVSGSGKSSLAFDTLFAEGQRRYVESLSTQARQLLGELAKPDVDLVEGLSPAVAVNQHSTQTGPRSTVGTLSEIGSFLRLLWARVGTLRGGGGAFLLDEAGIRDRLLALPAGARLTLLAPVLEERKGAQKRLLERLRRAGLVRVRLNGELRDLDDDLALESTRRNTIEAVVDRLKVPVKAAARLEAGIAHALELGGGRLRVEADGEEWEFAVAGGGRKLPALSPSLFSFNSRSGACPVCQGLGIVRRLREASLAAEAAEGLAALPYLRGTRGARLRARLADLAAARGFDLATPLDGLTAAQRRVVLHGEAEGFEGLVPYLERRYRDTARPSVRRLIERSMGEETCPACGGRRLSPEALRVNVGGLDFAAAAALSVRELGAFLAGLALAGPRRQVAAEILPEIAARIAFLDRVGLGYLSLDRPAATLSGGERQRLALAEQLGAAMTGVLYILDEPSVGLHPRDQRALLAALRELRDRGNTVLVVEHDRDTIEAADWIVDLGPGAGEHGGRVVATGTPESIRADPASPTGRCLLAGAAPAARAPRPGNGDALEVRGARQHNLRGFDLRLPLGTLVCVTGVSGSGKSSLVHDILYTHLAAAHHGYQGPRGDCGAVRGGEVLGAVVHVDQAPIGRSPRSNPATYSGLWTPVRKLFASLPESRVRGYGPGRFSFNVKGGRCETCQGDGQRKVVLHFLPPAYVPCESCRGRRFNRETLEIHYRGRNIAEILEMTVDQAREHFAEIPRVRQALAGLAEVGLGYLRLGQSALTLSGGEAQRLKLARELSRRGRARTLYILDEPSTGLHCEDVKTLMRILQRLVDKGHTVIIIEHNPDIIREADFVVDLGPEGGPEGGELLYAGPLAGLAACERSHTGAILRGDRAPDPPAPPDPRR